MIFLHPKLGPIPEPIRAVSQRLKEHNHQVFLVGGALRDMIRQKSTSDWDLSTDASPLEVESLFSCTVPVGRKYGTLLLLLDDLHLHITTFRGSSLEEDLGKRDFTINSMAYDLQTHKLLDPYGGRKDLKRGLLRAINPIERYREDPLRMLRLFRFVGQLGFKVDQGTGDGIALHLIQRVKPERILGEMNQLLLSPYVDRGLSGLFKSGLIYFIVPEFRSLQGEEKILAHIIKATSIIHPTLPLRWAAFLHDIGKGETKVVDRKGVHFYRHDQLGCKRSDEIMERLHFPEKLRKKVKTLIRHHMFSLDPDMTDRALLRLIKRVGKDEIGDLLELRRADIIATTGRFDLAWDRFSSFSQRIEALLAGKHVFSLKDLAIDGTDIMEILKLEEGKEVGKALGEALYWVMEEGGINRREELMAFLLEKYSKT